MVTLIEVTEGYEKYFDIVSNGQYRGTVQMEDLDLFIKGVTNSGGEVEFAS
jgi:hypothetical protein